jgi:hypothetical protein
MAALVITKDSWLSCSHGPPPGANVANNGLPSKLKVDGVEVMLAGDLAGATVSNCPQPNSSNSKACLAVVSRTSGDAQKLRVGGSAVLTDDTGGTTDGLPAPLPPAKGFSVSDPRQTKLMTV